MEIFFWIVINNDEITEIVKNDKLLPKFTEFHTEISINWSTFGIISLKFH